MHDFEKLGVFYLGRLFDLDKGRVLDELLLYDSKDLTTHAVCVGMTGSGKTGLGITLLEEAAIDGIPSLVIDPKGDMGNLLLTFPGLQPADFAPWVEPEAAARAGLTVNEYAGKTAKTWQKGIAEWGQDAARIEKFQNSVDVAVYTPGSQTGLPLTILRSFAAPSAALAEDTEAMRDRIVSAVSGLLALLGITADPIRSREHILLSNILQQAWSEGRSLDIRNLIREIQAPPFDKVGVFDLESFFPDKERMDLAVQLNNLLASPSFADWMEGEPLDVGRLLYTSQGKPRISILSIAHLNDTERMSFVTLLLNEVVSWMRAQPGTTSLRALLYMDEIFGYFPPTAVPPSKVPMLTLLKQARAYGLGVVLATQNPVDLDYKGLANTGTWFIGRLQTERDKLRVLEGLEGASQAAGYSIDRAKMDKILSALGHRVFLMHNVHEDQPTLYQTRWALSYLRGPLTRKQIQSLMAPRKAELAAEMPDISPQPLMAKPHKPGEIKPDVAKQPAVPSQISQFYLPVDVSVGESDSLIYRPALLGTARLHFVATRAKIDFWQDLSLVSSLSDVDMSVPWEESTPVQTESLYLEKQPHPNTKFSALPAAATRASSYTGWKSALTSHLYQHRTQTLWENRDFKQFSKIGESEGDFRGRLAHIMHEKRDLEVEKLRKRYAPKLARMQERVRKAQVRVEREKAQYGQQKVQTAVSVGATLIGAIFGRKTVSAGTIGRATTSMRGAGRIAREKQDIARAQREVQVINDKLVALEEEFQAEIADLKMDFQPEDLELNELLIRPRKTDITISRFALVWMPWKISQAGFAEPAFELKPSDSSG
jgi:hypothetical protein